MILTTCPFCSANCQIGLEVAGGKLLRVASVGNNLCVRGRFGTGFVQDPSRLKLPLVRKNGKLVEAGWDEALAVAAEGLARYTGEQFAAITSGVCTNEALYLVQKFAREVMNSVAVAPDALASGIKPEDLISASSVLVVGDLAETNPVTGLALRSAKNLVVISPLKTDLARASSTWLAPVPGQEASVLVALTRAISNEDLDLNGSGVTEEEIRNVAPLLAGATRGDRAGLLRRCSRSCKPIGQGAEGKAGSFRCKLQLAREPPFSAWAEITRRPSRLSPRERSRLPISWAATRLGQCRSW